MFFSPLSETKKNCKAVVISNGMPSKVWIIAALYPRMPVIIKYVQYTLNAFVGKKLPPNLLQ